ncbi:MAG: hypothetical protein R6V00_05095, partial [Candidatus Aminicenantes bacterium]
MKWSENQQQPKNQIPSMKNGILLTGPNTGTGDCDIDWIEGEGSIEYTIDSLPFLPGSYLFSVSIYDDSLRHA